jgi:hypothetical protein
MRKVRNANNLDSRYILNNSVRHYIEEKLQLENKRKRLLEKGRELTSEDKRKIRTLDRRKVYVLQYIFRSLANLTFFLEETAKNQVLQEIFEDDLKELFGIKDTDRSNNVLGRLVDALLSWDERKDPNNFRLGLIFILQNIIFLKINNIASIEFGDIMANNIVQPDMGRAWAWTNLYSKRVKKDIEEP